ncbi:glycosyl hydrolase family 8 [Viridibacillus sp. NPDC093762]|uniref:glycosyl hydrolase family 8 n=1 Tax=Viridibacillus sp. NPDC093762 TaxID=3390720 RepID=UPI003D065CED
MRILSMLLLFSVLILSSCSSVEQSDKQLKVLKAEVPKVETEAFIQKYLIQKDGRIRTNLTDRTDNYLSESVGLWMQYLVERDSYNQFQNQVEVLRSFFLTNDNLIAWELNGEEKAATNAAIDDLRIVDALFNAGEQWGNPAYTKLAQQLGERFVSVQIKNKLMVDYVDLKSKKQSNEVTISYIIPSGFDHLQSAGLISSDVYEANRNLLLKAPLSKNGFYPKYYDVEKANYYYDEEINLIDQLYVGYHSSQWKGNTDKVMQFLKKDFATNGGKLFGRYDAETFRPTVNYEAPSVYALAILFSLERGDKKFAQQLYNRMRILQQSNKKQEYYGGYIDVETQETHAFDNLLPLIAERKGLNGAVFKRK